MLGQEINPVLVRCPDRCSGLSGSVSVVLRLVGAFQGYPKVVSLFLRELGQLHADAVEVQASHFFVQLLGQTIDADLVGFTVGPEVELREASNFPPAQPRLP